ncbi:MFS transporter [Clostridium gelidum]|uniref:MFS transporter n=1 Tax=Clostridium gelidum TaxID=704125 RepID=A0ABM7T317_9CLOT|nr:MFS transporter [Clostridium gelidum]BCZ46021.1 MFS transporter [Clostridium gelidum]
MEATQNLKNKIGLKEKLSYACGDAGNNVIFASMSSFLVFYYTDVVKVSAVTIGSIMLISRVLDGFVDILMGVIIDKTKSKYGKARPWLLRMCIPFAIAAVLMFSVPDVSNYWQYVYIFVTYNIVNIIYTSINLPYGVLTSLMTQDQYERSVLTIFRMIFSVICNIGISMLTLPVVAMFGNDRKAWSLTYALFGAVAVVLFLITFFNTKERVGSATDEVKKEVPVKVGVKALFKNKYWGILTIQGLLNGANLTIMMGMNVYYAQYVLGNAGLVSVLTFAMMLPCLAGMFVLAPIVKKFGKRNVSLAGIVIMVIGYLIVMIAPTNLTLVLIGTAIRGLGFTPVQTLSFAMLADTVEYGEWKAGVRTEGLIYSAQSFGGKAGGGLGSGVIGWILGMGGYIGGAAAQSAGAVGAIKALFIFIPIAFVVVQFVILIPYKLDKEYSQVLEDLEKRKTVNN